MKIGVFDSGIGGLTVLDEVRKLLPQYDYIYYGDSANNPYGDKSDEELLDITVKIVKFLVKEGCRLIIIACNTATTRCRRKLMGLFPDIIFVGVVPAIKVACDNDYKNILVMATSSTVGSDRVCELVNDNKKKSQSIWLVACHGLADAIEKKNIKLIDELLNKLLSPYISFNIDCIVLGCTHYPLIKKNINKLFPSSIIIDGNLGVAKEVEHQLIKNKLNVDNTLNGNLEIYNSLIDKVL